MCDLGTGLDAYRHQLSRVSQALSAGDVDAALDDLVHGTERPDVERFVVNSFGERFRMLSEENALIALAFDDFPRVIGRYLDEAPRRTFDIAEADQQRFLNWLRGQSGLSEKQADFIAYQAAELACLTAAAADRAAHVAFQRRWRSWTRRGGDLDARLTRVHLNPVRAWADVSAPGLADDPRQPVSLLFFPAGAEIRSLSPNDVQRRLIAVLEDWCPQELHACSAAIVDVDAQLVGAALHELADLGAVTFE